MLSSHANPLKTPTLGAVRFACPAEGRSIVVDESQELASGASIPSVGLGRRPPLGLYAGSVLLAYGVPLYGLLLSLAVLIALLVVRRELWGGAVPRSALLAVLVWVGLWLPAISDFFTGWYWTLAGRDLSTAWLILPMQGPADIIVGTLVPALAAAVVFAVGLTVSAVMDRPWLVIVGAWLAPWAHELAFTMVTEMG
jgi:hypothetical protein